MKPILLAIALLLAACGPTYRTNYELFPPAGKEGQTCVANVKLMSDTCVENCRQMSRNCGSGFSTGIGFGTGPYYGSGIGFNQSMYDERDCRPTQCIESCLATARQAHVNCGGTVKAETVCTSNCPKPVAPAQPQ